ncbi:hypothetical protein ACFC14_18205 [Microbacterium sp. NPDC055988]|uniref:hypothetical protein n=1 Tax=Microbacterium sp. NPDC055988 TaxID=3345671 RepID=UPI0035D6FA7B
MDAAAGAWIGAIGGVIGGLAAVGAWIVAIRANGKSAEANAIAGEATKTSREALALQARIDEREREFRDVSWRCGWQTDVEGNVAFLVLNDGLTEAKDVTLALNHNNQRVLRKLGNLRPGEEARYEVPDVATFTDEDGFTQVDQRIFDRTAYVIHWASPLGHVETISALGTNYFV